MQLVYSGKVRYVYDLNTHEYLIKASDKVSAYDIVWGTIPNKGEVLTLTSKWWFEKTRHIVPNHFISLLNSSSTSTNASTIVRKCKPIPIEIVVRGYITGNTNTSLWTHYSRGEREYCGITLPDNLLKNQKLPSVLITPTTKSNVHDELISYSEILERNILSKKDLDYIYTKSKELFEYGQLLSVEKGLILVDTKYEFGFDEETGEILLIDELHTCDSSRYWKMDTYQQRFESGEDPDRFDKDLIRIWLKENYEDPYTIDKSMVKIPDDIITKIRNAYMDFYKTLIGNDV